MHDGINGDLSAIKYKITSINKDNLQTTEQTAHNNAIHMLDKAIEQVRHISHNLAPPSLQNFNLTEAIQQYCTKINATSSIKFEFQNYGDTIHIGKDNETAIFRIVQEAINNIVKHSKAAEALIQINTHNDVINLTIEDDGVGYDTNNKFDGIGLKNIKSRVAFLKSELHIETNSKGTSLHINIDLKRLNI